MADRQPDLQNIAKTVAGHSTRCYVAGRSTVANRETGPPASCRMDSMRSMQGEARRVMGVGRRDSPGIGHRSCGRADPRPAAAVASMARGHPERVGGRQQCLPGPEAAGFNQVSNSSAQTGDAVRFRHVRRATDRADQDPGFACRPGTGIYGVGTTFTRPRTPRARRAVTADDWTKIGGTRTGSYRATLAFPAGCSHQVGFLRQTGHSSWRTKGSVAKAGIGKQATRWTVCCAGQELRGGVYGLAIGYAELRPVEVRLAMSIQSGDPIIEGRTVSYTIVGGKAYQTYLGWRATDKVVDPAAVG